MQCGRDEIRQRLADARPRLNDQLSAFVQRLADDASHRRLLGTLFEVRERIARGLRTDQVNRHRRRHRDAVLRCVERIARGHRRFDVSMHEPRTLAVARRPRPLSRYLVEQMAQRPVARRSDTIRLGEQIGVAGCEPLSQRHEDAARRVRVGHRAMTVREFDAKVIGDRAEAALAQSRQQQPGKLERVVRWPKDLHAFARKECGIECRVLSNDRIQSDEGLELNRDRAEMRRRLKFRRIDAGEHRDAVLKLLVRIDERLERVDHARRIEPDSGDFDDLVGVRIKPGRFEIERNVRHGERFLVPERAMQRTAP